jgi:hypothetical protein
MSITEIIMILGDQLQQINESKQSPEDLVIKVLSTELNQVDTINKEFYYQTAY